MERTDNRELGTTIGASHVRAPAGARSAAWMLVLLFSVSSGAWATAAPATPTPAAPAGLGKAKLGMTIEQAREHYPALTPAPRRSRAAYFDLPQLARYVVRKAEVPGLKEPCDVELRFWKTRLWAIVVYYEPNQFSDVMANLRRQYGNPASGPGDPGWTLAQTSIVTAPRLMWYSVEDNELGKDVQRALVEAVQQRQARQGGQRAAAEKPGAPTPPGHGPPATPVPATPGPVTPIQ